MSWECAKCGCEVYTADTNECVLCKTMGEVAFLRARVKELEEEVFDCLKEAQRQRDRANSIVLQAPQFIERAEKAEADLARLQPVMEAVEEFINLNDAMRLHMTAYHNKNEAYDDGCPRRKLVAAVEKARSKCTP